MTELGGKGGLGSIADPRALLEGLFEHSPLAFQIYRADGHCLLVNRAFRELFGSEPPPEYNVFRDEQLERQGFLGLVHRAFTGETVHVPPHWYDPRELRHVEVREGRRVAIEVTLFPLRGEGGAVEHIALCFKDVTSELERAQAEESLRLLKLERTADAKLRGLLEAAPDAMIIVEGDGRIALVNAQAERLFAYPRDELLGQRVEMLIPERFRRQHAAHRGLYAASPRTRAMGTGLELYGRRKDGSEFPVEISLSPLVTEQGTLFSSAIRDVTERKQAEDDLRRARAEVEGANRDLEAFSFSVAHDLRAPLRAIDGFSQALQEDCADKLEAEGLDYLQRVRASAKQMSQLIDGLLGLARVTRGELAREEVDLGRIARQAGRRLRDSAPARDVELVVSDGLVAEGDPRLLTAVVENLLSNAWKFTAGRAQPRIEIGRTNVEGQSAFFVRDNGVGFEQTYAHKLFAPFQRLHKASEFEGSGIGLATVQRIVRRHGGRIWAEGAVDRGATFYFTL